jgi:hypothetical protein
MKTIRDDEYTYEPVYNDYDQRTLSEEVLEFTAACLIPLFILLGCWLGGSLLLLMVPKTMWLLYWPLQIIRFCGKWGTIIGWPLWLILEIYGHVQRAKEKHEENRRLNGEH